MELNLRYNGLDASCGKILQTIVARCQTLEKLDLRNNDLKVQNLFTLSTLLTLSTHQLFISFNQKIQKIQKIQKFKKQKIIIFSSASSSNDCCLFWNG